MSKWKTVALPEEVVRQIERTLKKHGGYASLNEFVRDACRRKLEQYEHKKPMEVTVS